jgi:hypothetical protein
MNGEWIYLDPRGQAPALSVDVYVCMPAAS